MSDAFRQQLQTSLGTAYTLTRELGGGGMSRVFVARDEALGRDVVIKLLAPELAQGLSAERFTREIKLAAALQEPHIVPVLAAGTTAEGLPYYSMPYVRGASLRQRLAAGGVPLAEAVGILRDVASALEHAHAQGVVHRDIKPENILLSGRAAVVTDFGIAKALQLSRTQAPDGPAGAADDAITQLGTSLGTPAYMAPEQAAGDPNTDARADIYAWGVVAYELLAGAHPFAGRAPHQLVLAHMTETPAPLVSTTTGVSRPLAALVMRSLEKDPARRPASAAELLAVLDAVHTGDEHSHAPVGRRARKLTAAVFAVVVLGGAAAFALRSPSASAADAASIAVLPFENQGAPEQAYFAEGLTNAVTGKLIGVAGLTVIHRRSAATYKGTTKTSAEIGKELGVAYLLEGVVRWARDAAGQWRAQVTPTLVRTRDGVPQWAGEPVIVTSTDPFTAQAEIATRVVAEIGVALASRERAALSVAPTKNPEAYELYMRAQALSRSVLFRPAEVTQLLDSAATLLKGATRLDPSFALAFADLASYESDRSVNDSTATGRYEAALHAALAVDPELPEAHFTRAVHLWFHESRLTEAIAEATRASMGRPGDANMLLMLGTFQIHAGQIEQGFANIERGVALDPRDATANSNAAYFAWHFRRLDALDRHARRIVTITPTGWLGYVYLTIASLARGDTAGARRMLADGARVSGEGATMVHGLFWILPATLTTPPATAAQPAPGPALPLAKGSWGLMMRGVWAREAGQPERARASFDSALVALRREGPLKTAPIAAVADAATRAIVLAATGRAVEARAMIALADSVERAKALPNNPEMAEAQDGIAYAFLVLGDRDAALARLERLLVMPSGYTPAMLRHVWPYASLHDDPRFRRLAEMDR